MSMPGHLVVSRQIAAQIPHEPLVAPFPYLSSADVGWEGWAVEVFHILGPTQTLSVHLCRNLLACTAEKERDMPLAFIVLESRLAIRSHFTRAFKRSLGVTPRTYRQYWSI